MRRKTSAGGENNFTVLPEQPDAKVIFRAKLFRQIFSILILQMFNHLPGSAGYLACRTSLKNAVQQCALTDPYQGKHESRQHKEINQNLTPDSDASGKESIPIRQMTSVIPSQNGTLPL